MAAARRGNEVLDRAVTTPVLGVAAAARMGVLVGNGGAVIQPPLGFGFGFDLRYHALAIAGARLGLQFTAGHDRYPGRNTFPEAQADGTIKEIPRYTILGHTDLTLGPSLQVPLRVLFLEGGVSGGLAISSFRRPRSLDPLADEHVVGYQPMIRGDLAVGVPIRKNQGIRVGADVVKIFATDKKTWIVADPQAPEGTAPDTAIFDLYLDVVVAYQMWF
ncbi:MAG: hypothetical protein H6710_10080 [Myxococcales bacterium]|nr:hypothetical protein [Myxococcales bacterium]